jgi:tripeptide aminopeptidase
MNKFTPLTEKLLDLAIAIQQIPAPTFAEQPRAVFVRRRFLEEGLSDVQMDELGNVYARLPGRGLALPIIVTAHMDTVFPAGTDLSLKREAEKISGPGIGDNSLGVAGLFGLLWGLSGGGGGLAQSSLPGDLWLVANVCEEGLGDLRGMNAVVERFGQNALAYIILEGMSLGQIYHRGLGVRRYRITVHTAGGHSWVDFGRPSAIHELAELIVAIKSLPLPDRPRTTLNVGLISGGTSINTIAAEAFLELDLRSEASYTLDNLVSQVETLVRAAEQTTPGIRISSELIGNRPEGEIDASHPLVRLAMQSLEEQGLTPHLNIGSTDANVPLSHHLPAICIGITIGGGAHTKEEYILTHPITQGLAQLVAVVEKLSGLN